MSKKEVRETSSTGGQKGVKLARFDLIPAGPLLELAEHYGRGAKKYAPDQWRAGYEWRKSIASLGRHYTDFLAGKDYDVCSNDPEGCLLEFEGKAWDGDPDTCWNHTGSHHMVAVAWHAFCLLEFKDTHSGHDDRYIPTVVDQEAKLAHERFEKAATSGRTVIVNNYEAGPPMSSEDIMTMVQRYDSQINKSKG